MNGRYLLDTNIIIALFAGEAVVGDQIRQAQELFVPSIALGELYYGAIRSNQKQENLNRLQQFVVANVILECDEETAEWYGHIKAQLARKGRPIPENDIWIAAIAKQYNLTLVSRDGHFDEIGDLYMQEW
jgi:tRNA(fMet)-specific endonuclease VapC